MFSILFSEAAVLLSAARMDSEVKYLPALALIKSLSHFLIVFSSIFKQFCGAGLHVAHHFIKPHCDTLLNYSAQNE